MSGPRSLTAFVQPIHLVYFPPTPPKSFKINTFPFSEVKFPPSPTGKYATQQPKEFADGFVDPAVRPPLQHFKIPGFRTVIEERLANSSVDQFLYC